MNTIIHHKGQSYVAELIPFERRVEMLKEKYSSLTKGCEEYNINPFPSKNWHILPKEAENSQELKEMRALAQYTGALKLDIYPLGTFYGIKPKEYDKIIVKLEWIFKN